MSEFESKIKEESPANLMDLVDRLHQLVERTESDRDRFESWNRLFIDLVGSDLPEEGLTYQFLRGYLNTHSWDDGRCWPIFLEHWADARERLEDEIQIWNNSNGLLRLMLNGQRIDCSAVLANTGSIRILMEPAADVQ